MPEALARADNDFVLRADAPSRRSRPKSAPKPERSGFVKLLFRRPGRLFMGVTGFAVIAGIGVNALFLQSERHPAPFFRVNAGPKPAEVARPAAPRPPSRPPMAAARPQSLPAPVPAQRTAGTAPDLPAAAPVVRESQSSGLAPAARANAGSKPDPVPLQRRESAKPNKDVIGDFIREGRVSSAPVPPAMIPKPSQDQARRVRAVQEALKKLSYNIAVDGVAGPSTRVAIEAFEKAQKMPVTGQLSPRVVKALAAKSGVGIP